MAGWKDSNDVEFVVLHTGIRDVRDENKDGDTIIEDTIECLSKAYDKYRKAYIMFSEILFTTDEITNDLIQEINNNIRHFCDRDSRYIYVPHRLIQETDSMFVDETHLNDDRGTKTFVKDITTAAFRAHKPAVRRQAHPRGDSGGSTKSVPELTQSGKEGFNFTGSDTWQNAKGTVTVDSTGQRKLDTGGARDLIKLFATLLEKC